MISEPLVESVILGNVYIMDILIRRLDTSYNKNIQNWQHLAYRQNVSRDMILKLSTWQSPASRSESLFELVESRNPDLTIGTLKNLICLENMGNVAKCMSDLEGI